jgi:hypothetical protein
MYKKISYLLTAALALGFVACSDQNEVVQDIYEEVANKPIVKHIEYTLTDADYGTISAAAVTAAGGDESKIALAEAVKSTNSLNEFATAAEFVPAIIANMYPVLKGNSTVQVTFNYSENLPSYLAPLASAATYTLKAADYASVWGEDAGVGYLTPANSPKAKLPAILKAALPEAASGDVVIATYKYSDQEPVLTPSEEGAPGEISEDFEGYSASDEVNKNGWSQADVTGTRVWTVKEYSGNKYAEVSSYGNPKETNNAYLVTPQIDLSKNANPVFAFDVEVRYPVAGQDYLRVLIAEDYKGDAAAATWTDVTENFTLPTAQGSMAPAGSMSLATYAGKMINIAFKYQGDGNASPALTTTLRIDNVKVAQATEVFSETFEDKGYANYDVWEGNGWTQIITQGTKNWQVRSYSGNLYGQMSANNAGEEVSEAYVVSPVIDLSATTDNMFSFSATVGYWNYKCLSVLVTEDAAALTTPATVEWNDVTAGFALPEEPASGYGTLSPVGTISLKQYDGKKIYIAFKYHGENGANTWTSTYQVDNISVSGFAASAAKAAVMAAPMAYAAGVISTPVDQRALYTFNGSDWASTEGAVVLSPADYSAMGSSYGNLEPEQATAYLPQYLAKNIEYAAEGDKIAVVYVRYEGSAKTVADEYAYTGGVWTPTNVPVTMTEQAKYEAGRGWWFDPTVSFTMATADYQLVIDYMKTIPDLAKFVNTTYNNEEFYFGFSSRYSNVSFRFSYRDDTNYDSGKLSANDTELHALDGDDAARAQLLWDRLEQKGMPLLLEAKYPLAKTQVSGIDVFYNVGVAVYYPDGVTSATLYYVMTYKVATAGAPGTPPTFTFIESKEVPQTELP